MNVFALKIRRRIRLKFIILFLLIILLFLYFMILFPTKNNHLSLDEIRKISYRVYGDKNVTSQRACLLPNLYPWDPEIRKKMSDPGSARDSCLTNILTMLTSLENGVLKVTWKQGWFDWFEPTCYYRCLLPIDDFNMHEAEWNVIDTEKGSIPNCDIVETLCSRWFLSNYRFMHTQIVEKEVAKNKAKNQPYNLYWLVIDSVSTSMFRRGFRLTQKVITEKFQAIEFPYLNKLPWNSRPNAYAMFFGEQAYMIEENPFLKRKESGKDPEELCDTPLDQFKFVGYDFREAGPDCIGFAKPPGKCFEDAQIGDQNKKAVDWRMRTQMYHLRCKHGYSYDIEHFLQFVNSYPGKPKFAITWITTMAHDDNTEIFGKDVEFAELFEELDKKAKNSFIIFQADHGIRTGPVRDIPIIGEVEDNNPFLHIIVPEKLRNNPYLMRQLKENARGLISQFDVYASSVEIAKFSHEWDENTRFDYPSKPILDRNFIGSSLFHPMKQPRTCENLNIPFDLCICYQESRDLDHPELARLIAQTIINSINKKLRDFVHRDKCQQHEISSTYPIRLEEFVVQKQETIRMLKARFETNLGALYQGFVQLNSDNSTVIMQKDFPRLNAYVDAAYCIPESVYKNYCVCRD